MKKYQTGIVNLQWNAVLKKFNLFTIAILLSVSAVAQHEKAVDSKITTVTVFLNKAQVTREAKTRVEAGKTNLILSGLTAELDQQSVQVAGKGAIVILGIGHQQNYLNDHTMPKVLQLLKDSLDLTQRQLILEQGLNEILNKEEQMLLSNQKIGGSNQNLSVAELKAMADFYRARLGDIAVSRLKQDEKIKSLIERVARLQLQINEQTQLRSRSTGEIVVSVSAEIATNVELTVSYIVANAGWYPVYDLRAINTKSPVQLSYKASVFQNTGEEWKNVTMKLSTANPNLNGMKPELHPWYLNFSQPVYRALQGRVAGVQVASAPASQSRAADMDMEQSINAVSTADYVTTIQTSLNTEFNIALPYTVNSSAKPTLVDIRNHELKADYLYSVVPKLDADGFLLARITGWEEYSLLPGETNVFFEGTFVAKTFIDPGNIKDTLAVSLGRDKRIVVEREKLKDFTSRKTIGSTLRDSYVWEISVRNTKTEPIKIVVEDQLPVSQNSQIEVTGIDTGGSVYSSNTGKLIWEFSLSASETKKLVYKFEVKYPKDKTVQGL